MLTVVYITAENERTLPVGRINGNCGDLDKDFVLANCGNRTFFCLDSRVRLDNDCSVGLWDFEVGHIERWFEFSEGANVCSYRHCSVRPVGLYIHPVPHLVLTVLVGRYRELLTKKSQPTLEACRIQYPPETGIRNHRVCVNISRDVVQ